MSKFLLPGEKVRMRGQLIQIFPVIVTSPQPNPLIEQLAIRLSYLTKSLIIPKGEGVNRTIVTTYDETKKQF